jgi:tetratricopeptide (TPR) repeat protein
MINALFDLLGAFYQSGDLVQAEWMARSILLAIPDDVVSLQFLGLVYYRTRRRAQALEAFSAADRAADGRSPAAGKGDDLSAAQQCLPAASDHGSTLAGAWYDLGLVFCRLRRHPQAIRAWQAALTARPDLPKAQRALSRIGKRSAAGSGHDDRATRRAGQEGVDAGAHGPP